MDNKYTDIKNVIEDFLIDNPTTPKIEIQDACTAIIDEIYNDFKKTKEEELAVARDEVIEALNYWADTLKSWGIEIKIDSENFITAMKEAEAGPKIKKTREEVKKPSADSIIDEYLRKYRKGRELDF